MKIARERKQKYLSNPQEEHHRLLIPRTEYNHWSNTSGHYSKDNIWALVTGTTKAKWDSDARKMERHLKYSRLDQVMSPNNQYYKTAFNPVEVPLLDILAVETERDFGWMFLSWDTMMELQANRGLARSMVRACAMREIILNQTEEEQRKIVVWHHKRMAEDQATMPGSPLSLDVEEVRCMLQDVLELAGLPHRDDSVRLSINPGLEHFGQHKDHYVQFPCRTMWGNGINWALMITILTNPEKSGKRVSHVYESSKSLSSYWSCWKDCPKLLVSAAEGMSSQSRTRSAFWLGGQSSSTVLMTSTP